MLFQSDEEEVKTDGVRVLENESDAGDKNGEDGDGDKKPEEEGENNGDVEMIVEQKLVKVFILLYIKIFLCLPNVFIKNKEIGTK